MAADEFISNVVLDTAMQPSLSEREKALRDLFVREYLYDHDPVAACLRCGFMLSFATDYAKRFMGEPYVRQQIRMYESIAPSNAEQTKAEDSFNKRRIINALFKEANYYGGGSSHSARVSALSKLASLHGMDKVTKEEDPQAKLHRGGVMRIPQAVSLDQWEKEAVASQEKLVAHARD